MPRFSKSRPTPGILPAIGTPRLVCPVAARLTPPRRAVPPSGTETVVLTVLKLKLGSWSVEAWPKSQPLPHRSTATASERERRDIAFLRNRIAPVILSAILQGLQ